VNDHSDVSDIDTGLRDAGRAFIAAAWPRLADARVVPRPRFQPYIEVGRDYFGDLVMHLPEYRVLAQAIVQAHPRFASSTELGERQFPDGLIFSLLEAFVALLTRSGGAFSPDAPAVNESLDHLVQAVRADSFEVACCRVVSHMTTTNGQPIDFGDVRLEPGSMDAAEQRRSLASIIGAVIPRAASAYVYERPGAGTLAASVLVARGTGANPYELPGPASGQISRFLLAVRLLKPCTSEAMYEVQGETGAVRAFKPVLTRFRGSDLDFGSPALLAPRMATLDAGDVPGVLGLGVLLDSVEKPRQEMVFTSFGMALQKFTVSYQAYAWSEQIVDLATALEATLSGTAKDEVTLRLRHRAAMLLATSGDSAGDIFNDVGVIYGLRSKLVHGGALKTSDLIRESKKISTVRDDDSPGVAVAQVVERLRDIVRRSLLARICLASGDVPIWPMSDDRGVDAATAADDSRAQWRSEWRDVLAGIGAGDSAEPAKRQPATPPTGGAEDEEDD
jgi:hypothetical protein